ncbi:hypothetical protein REH76_11640 [Photobacterium damselae]
MVNVVTIDSDSYKSLQVAQATYILALREMAIVDHISVACMCKISKDEAFKLTQIPLHELEVGLLKLPPFLNFNGVNTLGNHATHSIVDLLNSFGKSSGRQVKVTTQHMVALNSRAQK